MPRSSSRSKFKLHLVDRNVDRDEPDAGFESWADDYADRPSADRRAEPESTGRRIVTEGRSGRELVDEAETVDCSGSVEAVRFSSWDIAAHGPQPTPDWLVTSLSAIDTPLGVLKTGKEADVHLLDRSLPGEPGCLLAVKTYRSADHRMFHRDSGYQEGRRVRRSREGRAMAARTGFGRELLAGKWAAAEFQALSLLWEAGAPVPYPAQLIGTELMMEFIGSPDGEAAPRLAAFTPTPGDQPAQVFTALWKDLLETLDLLASLGLAHGDLSSYNVLVADGHCVLIDLPQVVDVIANPQGPMYLARDAAVIADFFLRRGVAEANGGTLFDRLADQAGLA